LVLSSPKIIAFCGIKQDDDDDDDNYNDNNSNNNNSNNNSVPDTPLLILI